MKKFLVVLLLVFSNNTLADGMFGSIIIPDIIITPSYGYYHQYSPLYFSRQPDYYYPPQPVYVIPPQPGYYRQAPVYVQPAQEYYENLELRRRYGNY